MNILACWCSLAGTNACQTCSQNPNAINPPPVRSYTVTATDKVLITGRKTNADSIRAMTDEELAEWLGDMLGVYPFGTEQWDRQAWLDWLKKEVEE